MKYLNVYDFNEWQLKYMSKLATPSLVVLQMNAVFLCQQGVMVAAVILSKRKKERKKDWHSVKWPKPHIFMIYNG